MLGHDTHGHAEETHDRLHRLPADRRRRRRRTAATCSASSARRYTDKGGAGGVPALTHGRQIQIRQKHQEVEYVVNQSGTTTATNTDGRRRPCTAAASPRATGSQLNGPFNLLHIDSITFRVTGGRPTRRPGRSRSGATRSTSPAAARSCRATRSTGRRPGRCEPDVPDREPRRRTPAVPRVPERERIQPQLGRVRRRGCRHLGPCGRRGAAATAAPLGPTSRAATTRSRFHEGAPRGRRRERGMSRKLSRRKFIGASAGAAAAASLGGASATLGGRQGAGTRPARPPRGSSSSRSATRRHGSASRPATGSA